ncbi:MAG: response regulator [Cyanobacteria bacterium J06642_12]
MKILLVEDDEQLAQIVSLNLKSQNYTVEWATDGQLGLDLVEAAEPDAVIVDYHLPKLNGYELCERVRATGNCVPILMMTSRVEVQDKIDGLDAGADDYLTKPFSLKELSARLRALMRRSDRAGGTPILTWGPLSLNPATCEVLYGDRPVPLRPKEYALLELFMRSPKQLFSRDAILDRLWTFDDAPNEETIKAHVKGMRKHLKQVGAPAKLIESVYGMGYRLNPKFEAFTVDPTGEGDAGAEAASFSAAVSAVEGKPLALPQWQQLKPKMQERVEAISTAVQAIAAGNLTHASVEAGCGEAHKLAGILGTVGFQRGTALARQIEAQLRGSLPSAVKLQQLLEDLQRELEREPDAETVAELAAVARGAAEVHSVRERPLEVLVIATDAEVSGLLLKEGRQHGMRYAHVVDAESARVQIDRGAPDVLAIAVGDVSATYQVLGELAEAVAAIPTMVAVSDLDLAGRVSLSRLGVKRVLEMPLQGARWFEAIRGLRPQPRPQSVTILAVDDDPEFLSILSCLLQPWGFEVVAVADADRAWKEMETLVPDLILLDVEMPGINGIELCQAIRSDERLWETPVLILASLHKTERVQQAFVAGADGFVKKPVVGAELIVRILNQLERKGIPSQSIENTELSN